MAARKDKKPIKLTRKVKDFILEKMSQGMDVSQIASKYPDKVPSKEHIYRSQVKDEEFAKEVDTAYGVLLMHRMDELHSLAGQTATEAYPEVEDWRQAEAALKRRIDEAKFVLGKMAPILSKRFSQVTKHEVDHKNAPQLAVVNYYQDAEKLTEGVTINQEGEKRDE